MAEVTVPAGKAPRDGLDIVYVLSLMQVAFLLLGAAGESVLMGGNPGYLLLPVVKSVLLLLFATFAVRRRRWALRALVVLVWITLAGVVLQFLVGLFPAVDYTLNLVGLMTNVALPAAVIWLCRPYLREIKLARREARAARLAAAQVTAVPLAPPDLAVVYPPVVHGAPIPYAPAGPDGSVTR
jgi:hypothetical protein